MQNATDIGVTNLTATPQSSPIMPPTSSPMATAPATPMADGGTTPTNSGGGFFKSINWLEVGFMVLGAWALMQTIKYYRNKMISDKKEKTETQKQIDELKMNLQSALKNKYKSL